MKGIGVFAAVLGGAVIGAACGLLFAPEKCSELRAKIAEAVRNRGIKLNKKEKQAAFRSALTDRVQQSKVVVVDELKMDAAKTKEFVKVLGNLKVDGKALVVMGETDKNVVLSARNIPAVKTTEAATINVYDVMNAQTVILTKDAVAKLEEVYA